MKNRYELFLDNIDLSFFLFKEVRKTLTIKILQNGDLVVKSPILVKLDDAKKFIIKHASWIEKKRSCIRQRNERCNQQYFNGCEIYYLGAPYKLSIVHELIDRVTLDGSGKMILYTTRPNNQAHIKKVLDKWFSLQAMEIFQERLYDCLYTHFVELKVPEFNIRSMKSRFGSYSSRHKITLNVNLIKTPKKFIDYVIIHELCHAYHMNHGRDFKKLLETKIPNWRQVRKDLHASFIL